MINGERQFHVGEYMAIIAIDGNGFDLHGPGGLFKWVPSRDSALAELQALHLKHVEAERDRYRAALEAIFNAAADLDDDCCPWCGAEEYGVDVNGQRLFRSIEADASRIDHYHIDHDDDCPCAIANRALAQE